MRLCVCVFVSVSAVESCILPREVCADTIGSFELSNNRWDTLTSQSYCHATFIQRKKEIDILISYFFSFLKENDFPFFWEAKNKCVAANAFQLASLNSILSSNKYAMRHRHPASPIPHTQRKNIRLNGCGSL